MAFAPTPIPASLLCGSARLSHAFGQLSHCQGAARWWEPAPTPMEIGGTWAAWDKMNFSWLKSRKEGGTGCTAGHPPERGSLLVCCLPKSIKKSHKTEIQVGKGCLELVHLTWPPGAWPQQYSIIVSWLPRWDGLHPGSSYPSAPLSSEEWGGWSREWGWSQNQASSRERGHPQGSFVMETTRQMKQRFSDGDGI